VRVGFDRWQAGAGCTRCLPANFLIEGQTMTISIPEFIAMIPAIERDIQASGPKIIEQACKIIQKRAKASIGQEHPGIWAPLAPSTLADKAKAGYSVPKPLLRTGELRGSIEYTVTGNEGCVGSNDPVAVYQEMGTSRIPPRSFLRSAAISSEPKIHRLAAAVTMAAFAGHGRNARDAREMLHLLHKAGHALKEFGEDLLGDDDDSSKDGHK
jgi:hypothetical protein